MVGEEREKAGARARVAQSEPGLLHPGAMEAVRSAMADTALDEFVASQAADTRTPALMLPSPKNVSVSKSRKLQN